MPFSLRYPQMAIRFSLTLVFLWFGLNKFIDPQHWIDALPAIVVNVANFLHAGTRDVIFLAGIFEVLVAISLATGFFVRWFSVAALVFVLLAAAAHGLGEAMIRDLAVAGSLVAMVTWPERNYF